MTENGYLRGENGLMEGAKAYGNQQRGGAGYRSFTVIALFLFSIGFSE